MNGIFRKDFQLFNCDNLLCLNTLADNSVGLIYSDILFGTGKILPDFPDLKPIKSEIEKHYLPRFTEMKRVLKNNGTIYIHCDWHINHWVRTLLDEVFGYENFLNEIIWSYNSAPRRKNCFGNRHDTIFRYSKTNEFIFNDEQVREPYSPTAPKEYAKAAYYHPSGKIMGDVWNIKIIGQNDKSRTGYSTEKPKELAERIIKVSSNEQDIVADFYMGSGVTAATALNLNRKFIGCDINERAFEITKTRLARWL